MAQLIGELPQVAPVGPRMSAGYWTVEQRCLWPVGHRVLIRTPRCTQAPGHHRLLTNCSRANFRPICSHDGLDRGVAPLTPLPRISTKFVRERDQMRHATEHPLSSQVL